MLLNVRHGLMQSHSADFFYYQCPAEFLRSGLCAFAKSKKGEKNAVLHKLFNDPDQQKALGATAEQKARIEAWVPECF